MIVYEEYASPAEKRQAQKGAKRGKPTGKARGYFFAFNENGRERDGGWGGMGCVYEGQPGSTDTRMAGTAASPDYLAKNCRRVGGHHLPKPWRALWDEYRKPDPVPTDLVIDNG